MRDEDMDQVRETARRLGAVLAEQITTGRELRDVRQFWRSDALISWLQTQAVHWAARGPSDRLYGELGGPLMTERVYRLLRDEEEDHVPAGLWRDLLLVQILAELHERGWTPTGPPLKNDVTENPVSDL